MNKNIIFLIAIIFIMALVGSFIAFNYDDSANTNIKNSRIILDNIDYEIEDNVVLEDGEIYVPYDVITSYISEDVRLTKNSNKILIKTKNLNFHLETKEVTDFVKNAEVEISVYTKKVGDVVYIPIESLQGLFGIEIYYNDIENILVIDRYSDEFKKASVVVDQGYIYKSRDKEEVVRKLIRFEKLRIFEEGEDWYRVRTDSGTFGYIVKNIIAELNYKYLPVNEVREEVDKNQKINLTWEFVKERSPNIENKDKIEGLDVLAPTWYSVRRNGDIYNKGDFKYTKDAHEKGYKVWGTIDNSFDPKLTKEFLRTEKYSNMIIGQILVYSAIHNLDGINIDFENIYYSDKQVLVDFVTKLSRLLKQQGLQVSMDVTVPGGSKQWSLVYDREKLAEVLDYICLMAYDEHWASSPKSGPVASIGWVEQGVKNSLKTIPKDKLILGVPFYARLWKEEKKNGKIKVSSHSIPIRNIDELLVKYQATAAKWDDETGHNYTQFNKDGKVYKMWIEDKNSLMLKLALIDQYDLAGSAAWRKGYEHEEIWEIIDSYQEE